MISREEHLKQINRFHDMLESNSVKIEPSEKEDLSTIDEFCKYCKYNELSLNIWPIIDYYTEQIKSKLDEVERNWENIW